MVQGISMTCVKYTVFVFNFILVICGLVLVIVGALVTKTDMTEFMDNKYVTSPIILMFVGCVIFVVAFFGCCGAVRENSFMVITYGLLIFAIFVIEIAGGVTAYIYREKVESFLKDNMHTSLSQQKEDSIKVWNEMQKHLQCCGVDGAKDYTDKKISIPKSCCKDNKDPCPEAEAYPKGCYPQMLDKAKSNIAIVAGIAGGFAVIELLGCMFAWCLYAEIKRDEGV